MYDIKLPLTVEIIEQFVTPYEIFANYIDHFPGVNISFRSQLRTDDKNPSCRVTSNNGNLWYKDFSRSGSLNCYRYVMEKFGLTFMETLGKIRNDFGLLQIEEYRGKQLPQTPIKPIEKINFANRSETIILKKARGWELSDTQYWTDRYGITLDWLEEAKIEPISHFWLKNERFDYLQFDCPTHSYVYNYYWHKDIFRRKIYQPFSQYKWLSNVDSTIVQGWDLLPKNGGNILIITSSYKDAGTIMCNLNPETIGEQIYAIAPNNEETFIPQIVFDKLKKRWNHILLWYNNDFEKDYNTGYHRSVSISQDYQISYLLTPTDSEKDPSDYRHHYGEEEFIRMTLTQLDELL